MTERERLLEMALDCVGTGPPLTREEESEQRRLIAYLETSIGKDELEEVLEFDPCPNCSAREIAHQMVWACPSCGRLREGPIDEHTFACLGRIAVLKQQEEATDE